MYNIIGTVTEKVYSYSTRRPGDTLFPARQFACKRFRFGSVRALRYAGKTAVPRKIADTNTLSIFSMTWRSMCDAATGAGILPCLAGETNENFCRGDWGNPLFNNSPRSRLNQNSMRFAATSSAWTRAARIVVAVITFGVSCNVAKSARLVKKKKYTRIGDFTPPPPPPPSGYLWRSFFKLFWARNTISAKYYFLGHRLCNEANKYYFGVGEIRFRDENRRHTALVG